MNGLAVGQDNPTDGVENSTDGVENSTDGVENFFSREVLPILSNKCFVCHGPDSDTENELRLDTLELATKDLGGYRAIDPENPDKSEVLVRIHSTDDPMPPEDAEKQLSDAERMILSRWIKEGGKYSKHWAFVIPRKTAPPKVANATGAEAIDAFVQAGLAKKKIDFAPDAERETLARRVALTLTGLPPSPELLSKYLNDQTVGAYDRLVDALLASPQFGEHQARYWLDAVRYGDTHGLHLDNKRGIYPFRDWVVKALNENLSYDKFITWQLAGDLLPDPTLEQLVATGFVRMNPSTAEGGAIPAEFQAKNNFDRTENFGTVFLGMSLVCARCHTHKYDPIPQTEYYRLMAFFNSTAEGPMDGNAYVYGPVVKAPKNLTEWAELDEYQLRRDKFLETVAGQLNDKEFSAAGKKMQLEQLVKSSAAIDELKYEGTPVSKIAQAFQAEYTALEKKFTTTLVAKELPKPRETKLLHRGEYNQPQGDALPPGVISVANPLPGGAPANRLGLAKWLLSRENPLTSRVLVNRIWQRVFGDALVRTPEDFGLQGQQPTHPELLDWLAVDFQDSKWDLKKMIKQMVMSRTFRQSSAWRKNVDDPENKLFARGPSYRLDAEVLRDIALWGSGLMVNELGGEGIKPYQPPGMWLALAHPGSNTKNYVADKGAKLYRRSLYVYWKRTSPHPMMTLFDAPSRESSCVRRSRTNTSLQSLGLFNEMQRNEFARKFAERLLTEKESDQQRLSLLYKLVICRAPDAGEQQVLMDLLNSLKKRYQSEKADAAEYVQIGPAPFDQKLSAEEVAAWAQVIVTVLASDSALLLY